MRSTRPPPPPEAPPAESGIGPFHVIDRIAVGGMAEVFRAEDRRQTPIRTVVVKRMLASLATDAAARAMFAEEARLGALVSHPGVVRVLGHDDNEGQPYLVLEHVPGIDLWRLSRWLTRQSRTLDVPTAVHIGIGLLEALRSVHQATDRGKLLGLVHKDISPSNVLLSMEGSVKLIDFGIAEAQLRDSPRHQAMLASAKGKLGYLAPEQVRGEPADQRADVFSAAVVLAELFLGRPLFAGGSELAVLLAIRDAQIRPFDELRSTLPRPLHEAITAALHVDPAQRTASVDELAKALLPFRGDNARAAQKRLASLVAEAVGTGFSAVGPLAARGIAPAEAPGPNQATRDAPALSYWVKRSGDTLGPFTYAKLVEAIATRDVGIGDEISVQGGAFAMLETHPDLARHLPPSSLSETTRDQTSTRAGDRIEDLERTSFSTLMGTLLLQNESGLLLCARGNFRKEVYLTAGVPEFVASNLQSELLGEFLVQRGLVTRSELDMALAVMPRFEGRLGDTLSALGLVEPVQLFREIGQQVQDKLLELFVWSSGRAEFFRGVPQPQSGFPLGLDPWRILVRGMERRIAAGLEDELLDGRKGLFITVTRPAPRGLAQANLPPYLKSCLERARNIGQLGDLIHELSDPTGKDAYRGRREVAVLVSLGALTVSN